MSRRKCLNEDEKSAIVCQLNEGKSVKQISADLKRDPRTIKKFVANPFAKTMRKDKGKNKVLSRRDLSRITRQLRKAPTATSGIIFKNAGIENVSKSTRCKVLRGLAKHVKPDIRPPLKERHKVARREWARKYLKLDFQTVLFTDESRATLDGPDGWSKIWVPEGAPLPQRLRRQQGGGGVMFWAGIVGKELVGPFRVPDGVKLTSATYTDFLQQNVVPWYKKKKVTFKRKLVFMHDNAPSHSAKSTVQYLEKIGFKENKLMTWPACSPDLNPIENLWAVLKLRVYQSGQQFTSKDQLWAEIVKCAKEITEDEILKLTESMDKRLFSVIQNHGGYIHH
jgi:transposase